jgi:hypothetical protein
MDEVKILSHIISLLQDSQQLSGKNLVSESMPDIHKEGLISNADQKDLDNQELAVTWTSTS